MTFRDREKERYIRLKRTLFSEEAQGHGTYRGKKRPYCLADSCSSQNLWEGIRKEALAYFRERGIPWHDGLQGRRLPSNHPCCSQSCCLNFLFPLTTRPHLLARVFRHIYPQLAEPLPVTEDGRLPDGTLPYMAFEWTGTRDYLGEHVGKRGIRTRGANYTSADFAFRFRREDGKIHLVLGEWKYTEEAGSTYHGAPRCDGDRRPEVRKRTYERAFARSDGVFAGHGAELYNALFFGPFYQFMRLQLLAQEMERGELGPEMNADVVSVLCVCPAANDEFRKGAVVPPQLQQYSSGADIFQVWQGLVPGERFRHIPTEVLLCILDNEASADDSAWVNYLRTRYGWS